MKIKNSMKSTLAAIAAGFVLTGNAFTATTDFPTPLPGFKSDSELAEWRNDLIAKAKAEEAAAMAARATAQVFYTGKPFVEETGEYAFLYRNYNPEFARWSSHDPSGFPDGANNLAYMAVPTSEFDWLGLAAKKAAWLVIPNLWGQGTSYAGGGGNYEEYFQGQAASLRQEMTSENNQSPSPNYLRDGTDTFNATTLVSGWSNFQNIIGNYTKVWLITHGQLNDSGNFEFMDSDGAWRAGDSLSHLQGVDIVFATCFNNFSPNGLNGAEGIIEYISVFPDMNTQTKDYLRE